MITPKKMHRKTTIALFCMALAFSLTMAGCGGGSGSSSTPLKTDVTVTGKVAISSQYGALQGAECRLVDNQGDELAVTISDANGQYTLNMAKGGEGHIYCTPAGFSNLDLSTYCSTKALSGGVTLEDEDVNIFSTVAAQVIASETPADPLNRKVEVLAALAEGQDPDLSLVAELSEEIFAAMLNNGLDIDFTGGFNGAADSDGGISGKVCTGVAQTPIAGAQCVYVVDGDLGTERKVLYDAVLVDLGDNGRLSRSDLKAIQDQVNGEYRWREQEIMTAFGQVFPNGIGQAYFTTTDENGDYMLTVPPESPGYVCCTPPDQDQLVLSAYVPGRLPGEILNGQDVTPATTVHSVQIASRLNGKVADIPSTKEAYLQDIDGLAVQMIPDNAGLSGFQLGSGTAPANKSVGLAAFGATVLFNVLYHSQLNVEFPTVLADFCRQQRVDPEFLAELGMGTDDALACADVVGAAVTQAESSLDVQLGDALSTARINVTVLETADGSPVSGVEVSGSTAGNTSLNCVGCDTPTDAQGRVSLLFSELTDSPQEIHLMGNDVYDSDTPVQVMPLSAQDVTVVLHNGYYLNFYSYADADGEYSDADGTGVVTSENGDIDCFITREYPLYWDKGCSARFAPGTQVTLTASSETSTFVGWAEGTGCSGTAPTCTVTMDSNHDVVPLFSPRCEQIREDWLYDILPVHFSFTTNGVNKFNRDGSIMDHLPSSCGEVSASTDSDWITTSAEYCLNCIIAGVSVNSDPGPRTGTILYGGYPITVAQDGQQCGISDYGVAPVSSNFDAAGGTGTIAVRASANCPWQAVTDKQWITITAGGDGSSGNGTVTYSVSENTGASRWSYIIIAGTYHLVVQRDAAATPPPTLTIQGDGDGSGVVVDSRFNIFCHIDGSYASGQCNLACKPDERPDREIELIVSGPEYDIDYASTHSVFSNWTGSCNSSLTECHLTMEQAHTAIARFLVSDKADLAIDWFDISTTYIPTGEPIPVEYTELWSSSDRCKIYIVPENRGIADAQDFSIGFYISSDATISTDDILLANGRVQMNGIAAKQPSESYFYHEIWLPTDLPPGPAYLGVLIDEFNTVDEDVEANNSFSVPVYIVTDDSDISASENSARATSQLQKQKNQSRQKFTR